MSEAVVDAILEVETGDRSARSAVRAKSRAPCPHELERFNKSWQGLAARASALKGLSQAALTRLAEEIREVLIGW